MLSMGSIIVRVADRMICLEFYQGESGCLYD